MRIEQFPIEKLKPFGRRLRKNNHAVDRVAEAISVHGFWVPVLVTERLEVIDGDLRVKAASRAGMTAVPGIRVDGLPEERIRSLRLSLHRMAELANWDEDLLALEFAELKEMDYPLELTGFDMEEIDRLLASLGAAGKDPDAVPPAPARPVSRPGDIWTLSGHRVMCGDSTSSGDWARLMAGEKADMIWTDPPYNVAYESKAGKIRNDDMSSRKFAAFMADVFRCLSAVVSPGGPVYVAHADTERVNVQTAFEAAGFKLAACLIWKKNQMVLGRADYHWQHEPILYGWLPGKRHRWYGGRRRRSVSEIDFEPVRRGPDGCLEITADNMVWQVTGEALQVEGLCPTIVEFDKPLRNPDHPTMKPVALVEYFLANSSRPLEIVADGFGGSGSTLIACQNRQRFARVMELEPKFVDVMVRRWQEFTGAEALHADTQQPYSELSLVRSQDG